MGCIIVNKAVVWCVVQSSAMQVLLSCVVAHQIAMYVWDHSLPIVTALLLLTHKESSWVVVELIGV